jgi:hypothetical protein
MLVEIEMRLRLKIEYDELMINCLRNTCKMIFLGKQSIWEHAEESEHSLKLIQSQPSSVSALPISARRLASTAPPWRAPWLTS